MATSTFYRNPDWLRQKYWDEGFSMIRMAELCSCEKGTIMAHMDKYGIKRRSIQEAARLRFTEKPHWNRDWVYKMYHKKGYSITGLARFCGIDKTTMKYWLAKHSIQKRPESETKRLARKQMLKKRYGSFWQRLGLAFKESAKLFRRYL